jgi:hypothetical protein
MSKVRALISGIDDPKVRLDVAQTINFLAGVYSSGRINDNQLRDDLFEICSDVIAMSNPDLDAEEVRKRASVVAEELFRAIRIESVARRIGVRYLSATRF